MRCAVAGWVQENEQTVMQYSRKMDTYGDCEMTPDLGDASTLSVRPSVCLSLSQSVVVKTF